MALNLTYSFGTLCSGGNHLTVTATLTPGGSMAFPTEIGEIKRASTAEEKRTAALVILRLLVEQIANQTNAQIKAAIEAKTVNLTVS